MKKLYHFFGGITFAVILIATVTLFVIVGTFLESATGSHRYASQFTYQNPLFLFFLGCFFINILFSATRRYPFKKRHIPFLITHLGLLMILTGCFVKSFWGFQGEMIISEGSGSHEIILPGTFTLKVEPPNRDLKIITEKICPNCIENYESWIKEGKIHIVGLPPITSASVKLFENSENYLITTVEPILEEGLHILLSKGSEKIYEGPYQEKMGEIAFNLSSEKLTAKSATIDSEVPLKGPKALQNFHKGIPIRIELKRAPRLHFYQNQITHLGPHGEIETKEFKTDSLMSYDQGFGGYTAFEKFTQKKDLQTQEREIYHFLENELKKQDVATLSPPLQLLHDTCEKAGSDFATTCLDFLIAWNNTGTWLFPEKKELPPNVVSTFKKINWDLVPLSVLKGCQWTSTLFDDVEPQLAAGIDAKTALTNLGCPIPSQEDLLTAVTQQIFAVGERLPFTKSPSNARLFSAYLRAYGIHFSEIQPDIDNDSQTITLESPLLSKPVEVPAGKKLEDNNPLIHLSIGSEKLSLRYNSPLKWPILNGKHLLRYQPETHEIPHHIRLRQARQIRYAGSANPFSYEADLLITSNGSTLEKTISMNNVHETWDGTRFYLASISPPDETAVKRIQLSVNHDPARYFLTYPGGLLVTLGAFLLFWFKKKTSKAKDL